MPKQSIDDQIRSRIDIFVEELSALVREAAIEAVGDALQDGSTASTRRRGPTASKATGRGTRAARTTGAKRSSKKRVRRSADEIAKMGERVLAYVKTHPGTRMEQIAKALRKETKDLRRSVQELIASKSLRTEGQKRATAYYAGGASGRRSAPKKKTAPKARKKAARKAKRKTALRKAA